MAQWWAKWRGYSYRMAVPNSSQRKGKFDVAHLGAQCLRNSCVTLAVLGVPTSSGGGGLFEVPHWLVEWLHNPCCPRGPQLLKAWMELRTAHCWVEWLHNPCRLGDPQLFTAGWKI